MKNRRGHACKIGTIPHYVYYRYNYKPTVGKYMYVRNKEHGSKFFKVRVTAVNEDGYFFAEKI